MVEQELQSDSGERLLWTDQPIPGVALRNALPIVLFGIPWTAFSVFWVGAAAWGTSKGDSGLFRLFPLFGLPFVAIGVGLLSSPWWAFRSAQRSAYAITDRRAIIFQASWNGSITVRSFAPERLTDLRRKQRADGSGDLVFAEEMQSNTNGRSSTSSVGFLAVRDVKGVEELVQSVVERARDARSPQASRLLK
jgi:hypothetical protein